MRGFFGRGVYNGVETQPGGGEDVQEREMIAQLLQQDERGMEALLLHYGPLMRYIIAPILPDPQDREECLSEVSMRVWSRIAQFDPARASWNAWLTAITRNTARNYQRSAQHHSSVNDVVRDIVQAYIRKHPSLSAAEVEVLYQSNYQLLSIGRNLNQVARQLNMGESASITSEHIKELTLIIKQHTEKVADVLRTNRKRLAAK